MRDLRSFVASAGLLLACLLPFVYFHPVTANEEEKLLYPDLVRKFYQQNQNKIFWFTSGPGRKELRQELINCIDTAMSYGLLPEPYHYKQLEKNLENGPIDSLLLLQVDKTFTDAAIACMKNIYEGYKSRPWVEFDQLSSKYEDENNQFLLGQLHKVHYASDLKNLMELLQPHEKEYQFLKQELKNQKQKGDKEKIEQLTVSLNYFRWIHHFKMEKAIVVNIGSAYLRYYENDSLVLLMKVVVGKPSTPTPRFAAWCDQVILYPYWYVPHKIAVNEYLRRFKRNPALIDAMNMQVIDANGKVLNHYKLDWPAFTKNYFPYTLRQSTGCDNALGVIKFNLTSPYGVYLHDTNNKTAFFSGLRYYSHGCIRIEEPIELGNHLLNNKLDTTFLQSCFREQKPIPVKLDQSVPVFVIYMPTEAIGSGKVRYYKDVYKLLK
jgi:murein L,D-transpeptidase YcbB/YkuD